MSRCIDIGLFANEHFSLVLAILRNGTSSGANIVGFDVASLPPAQQSKGGLLLVAGSLSADGHSGSLRLVRRATGASQFFSISSYSSTALFLTSSSSSSCQKLSQSSSSSSSRFPEQLLLARVPDHLLSGDDFNLLEMFVVAGVALPDVSFQGNIPTNPIEWLLVTTSSASSATSSSASTKTCNNLSQEEQGSDDSSNVQQQCHSVIGAGAFRDAAESSDGVVCFSLEGSVCWEDRFDNSNNGDDAAKHSGVMTMGRLRLKKMYQRLGGDGDGQQPKDDEASSSAVTYEGTIFKKNSVATRRDTTISSPTHYFELSGKWSNFLAAESFTSFGSFVAAQQKQQHDNVERARHQQPTLVHCCVCSRWKVPGTLHFVENHQQRELSTSSSSSSRRLRHAEDLSCERIICMECLQYVEMQHGAGALSTTASSSTTADRLSIASRVVGARQNDDGGGTGGEQLLHYEPRLFTFAQEAMVDETEPFSLSQLLESALHPNQSPFADRALLRWVCSDEQQPAVAVPGDQQQKHKQQHLTYGECFVLASHIRQEIEKKRAAAAASNSSSSLSNYRVAIMGRTNDVPAYPLCVLAVLLMEDATLIAPPPAVTLSGAALLDEQPNLILRLPSHRTSNGSPDQQQAPLLVGQQRCSFDVIDVDDSIWFDLLHSSRDQAACCTDSSVSSKHSSSAHPSSSSSSSSSSHPSLPPSSDRCVLYTSGTSGGSSKGVHFSDDLVRPTEGLSTSTPFIQLDFQSFDPTFPLSLLSSVRCGGTRFFVQPCSNNSSHQQQQNGSVDADGGVHRTNNNINSMFDVALEIAGCTHIGAPPAFWTQLLHFSELGEPTEKVRSRLGNRLLVATSGGGPCPLTTLQFCNDVLGLDLVSLYGSREAGGISRNGVVLQGVEVIIAAPKTTTTTTTTISSSNTEKEDASAVVIPANEFGEAVGEICVHSPRMVVPKNDAEKAAKYVTHGTKLFIRTGDLGRLIISSPPVSTGAIATTTIKQQQQQQQPRLEVIGRASRVQKDARGEWCSPATAVEEALESHPMVLNSFVFSWERNKRKGQQQQEEEDSDDVSTPAFYAVVVVGSPSSAVASRPQYSESNFSSLRSELLKILAVNRVPCLSWPKFVLFSSENFSERNGLLTANNKKRLDLLLKTFSPRINEFEPFHRQEQHSEASDQQRDGDATSTTATSRLPKFIADIVRQLRTLPSDLPQALGSVGCDSLTTVRLLEHIKHRAHISQLSIASLFEMEAAALLSLLEATATSDSSSNYNNSTHKNTTTSMPSSMMVNIRARADRLSSSRLEHLLFWEKELRWADEAVDEVITSALLPKASPSCCKKDDQEEKEATKKEEEEKREEEECWLLSGMSGFLGLPLIVQLVTSRRGGAAGATATPSPKFILLVRGPRAKERFFKLLAETGLVRTSATSSSSPSSSCCSVVSLEEMESCIEILEGDVTDPLLGLGSVEQYQALCRRITHVLHNAAVVSKVAPYAALKKANVTGTLHMLRAMATSISESSSSPSSLTSKFKKKQQKTKTFIYVSSVAALPAGPVQSSLIPPTESLLFPEQYVDKEPYGQTKSLSERMVLRFCTSSSWSSSTSFSPPKNQSTTAAAAALPSPCCQPRGIIFRPSAISADSRSGFCNLGDFVTLLVLCCRHMTKCFVRDANHMLNCVPVDFVSLLIDQGEKKFSSCRDGDDAENNTSRRVVAVNITQAGPPVSAFFPSASSSFFSNNTSGGDDHHSSSSSSSCCSSELSEDEQHNGVTVAKWRKILSEKLKAYENARDNDDNDEQRQQDQHLEKLYRTVSGMQDMFLRFSWGSAVPSSIVIPCTASLRKLFGDDDDDAEELTKHQDVSKHVDGMLRWLRAHGY